MIAAGIVAALPEEARALGHRVRPAEGAVRLGDRAWLALSGCVGPAAAVATGKRLLAAGAGALVSWGTAGALEAGLAAGDLLLPGRILDGDGRGYDSDADWLRRARAGFGETVMVHGGTLLQSPEVVASSLDKRQLRERFAAVAVDMESAALARLARQRGVPFLVVRVIVDTASTDMPRIIGEALDGGGRVRRLRLLRNAALRPSDLPALFVLGRQFKAAHATLKRLADSAASGFFISPDGVPSAGNRNVRMAPEPCDRVRSS